MCETRTERVFVSQLAAWGLVCGRGGGIYVELKLVKTLTAASESRFLHDGKLYVAFMACALFFLLRQLKILSLYY